MNGRDSTEPRSKGHLNPTESAPIRRYRAPGHLAAFVRHYWVPEWTLPEGRVVTARVLGYPSVNLVIDRETVLVSGPTRRESRRVLRGRGWAFGVLLQPAATPALGLDGPALVDAVQPLAEPELQARVTGAMEGAGSTEERHAAAATVVTSWLEDHLEPLAAPGRLANDAVAIVEGEAELIKVGELAQRLHVTARTLQRAVRVCTGFTPAEVIARRRLQDATDRLRGDQVADLARLAHETGYSDHAHMTRNFRDALDEPPSEFRRGGQRRARVQDVHDTALALPHVTVDGPAERPVYQVGGKSFVFFRRKRPDAVDPETGERYDDVIVFWVADEGEKTAMVVDPATPYFTTPHFDGHPSVLLRASRIGELTRDEVVELVQDAWLCRASPTRARRWLAALDPADPRFVAPVE